MPDFYPETECERLDIGPDEWGDPAVYGLACETPETLRILMMRWGGLYEVYPPKELIEAVDAGRRIVYVGATTDLLARLHDHVDAEVRVSGLLQVCPPTGLEAVWPVDDPFTAEVGHAIDYSNRHADVVVACNGDWF